MVGTTRPGISRFRVHAFRAPRNDIPLEHSIIPVAVHLVLPVVAISTLPLSIASSWGDPRTSGYAFWLLGLFLVSIGLPFFALAANNPLLQAWFVRTGHPSGPDPYFLYAS